MSGHRLGLGLLAASWQKASAPSSLQRATAIALPAELASCPSASASSSTRCYSNAAKLPDTSSSQPTDSFVSPSTASTTSSHVSASCGHGCTHSTLTRAHVLPSPLSTNSSHHQRHTNPRLHLIRTTSTSATPSSSSSSPATARGASVDPREAAKFAALAASWWCTTEGPFAPLHALNPARVKYVRQSLAAAMGLDVGAPEPLAGLRLLDVGCGGGILSEALARLGAEVHGIDVTRENVEAARLHAGTDPRVFSRVRYDVISAEDLAASGTAMYDAVIASEVLEHVSKPHQLMPVLASLVAEGGALLVSTINRTPAAWAVAVAGAEYVARVVPPGTHKWSKFITPEEMAIMADSCGLQMWHAAGMAPLGPHMSWTLTNDLSINYIATLLRRRSEPEMGAEQEEGAGAGVGVAGMEVQEREQEGGQQQQEAQVEVGEQLGETREEEKQHQGQEKRQS
ncbi:hypothetical protein Agub_g14262 [Astrephomene gubernaculifera]|uniref:Ubiquinone biosynthesis O-methyltransferase, mitochondrial n=1 Tax=Astrephomene gubernaculifera TaxID=47775 RepID=A0AAD3E3R0_9CHLO|nr:hypothetical protein Agub_g14262 [Astrephomene gubernaculifera]